MTKSAIFAGFLSVAALAGCQLTPQDQANLGLLIGAGTGVALADLADANTEWTILAGVGGAVAGTLLARNATSGQCAYSNGDGTYSVAPC